MTSKSKSKGNTLERTTAHFLTTLYNETFLRVPSSGAYIGGKNVIRKTYLSENQVKNFRGDIIPADSFDLLNIECKSYADFPFHLLFSGNVRQLDTWIQQCLEVADENTVNILIMKFNRKGCYVAIENKWSGIQTINSFKYSNPKVGEWLIMEHNQFWELNAKIVKDHASLINREQKESRVKLDTQ